MQYMIEYFSTHSKKHRVRTEERILDNFAIFPIDQDGGLALALMLEPRSKYGLVRYEDPKASSACSEYPIVRIVE
jgi:hypothetical protein